MENSSQEREECKIYGFIAPNGDSRTFQLVKQFVHSSLEKRAIIVFFNLFTLVIS